MPPQVTELERAVSRLVLGRRIVVALSGGRDSMALLELLVRGGADVRAAHVDHGLRTESAADAAFCRAQAGARGVPFALARINVERGNSTQGRARTQRYAALVRLAHELGGDVLAVAHHADDAWESSELQLSRGAGIVGAAGPRVWSDWWGFEVVRPILHLRRAELHSYADDRALRWREDPSNADPSYARVRLRESERVVDLPALEQRHEAAARELEGGREAWARARIAPQAVQFERAALPLQRRNRVLLDAARGLHGELPGGVLAKLPTLLWEPRWFCGRQVVLHLSRGHATVIATRGQGTRLLDARATPTLALCVDARLPWFQHHIVVGDDGTAFGHVRLQSLDGVELRGPRPGDRLKTQRGVRRVADVLNELRIPPCDRWCWPCLFVDDRCLAVAEGAVADGDDRVMARNAIGGVVVGWDRGREFQTSVGA